MDLIRQIWVESGIYQISPGQIAMIVVCLLLLYLGIVKKFEPLLLVTIGFGGLLSNIPGVEIATGDGLLHLAYVIGIETGAFPLIIFMGVGAMTDFGPLLANPRTLFLGAAAQFGIFATLLGALGLTELGLMDFSLREAAAIGIIGGADGPTAIYVAGQLAPHLLGAIAVAAYSYMALVPLIQPPIMRLLTTEAERKQLEWNARRVLTLWGTTTRIDDYACKEWSGMISGYYHARWKWYLDEVGKALESGKPHDGARFQQELRKWMEAWSDSKETYPVEASGDSVAVAKRLWKKYGDAFKEE